jgi:DNA-binding transcriptional LysR family regulator
VDLEELRRFVALARKPNVTAVALEQHVSQPALSRAIARVEQHFGTALFDRHGGRLTLNRFGIIVEQCAQRAIEDLEIAKTQINALIDPEYGEIRIAYLHGVGSWFLPGMINPFHKLVPGSKFELLIDTLDTVEDTLRRGRADIVVTTVPPKQSGISWHMLFREELFVALAPEHPLACQPTIQVQELENEKFIISLPNTEWRPVIDSLFENAGIHMQIAFETAAREAIRGFVAAGLGISILPRPNATPLPNSTADVGEIVYIPTEGGPVYGEIGVAWLDESPLTPIAGRFLEYLLSQQTSAN